MTAHPHFRVQPRNEIFFLGWVLAQKQAISLIYKEMQKMQNYCIKIQLCFNTVVMYLIFIGNAEK
ncbi:hypothetical protein AH553_25275 [Salmonella enterica subsp. diarizonae]|nr:hypothetical protein [Salmonella enterica subsp. diarizonae]